jgi:type IV pilus assembly protein PilC
MSDEAEEALEAWTSRIEPALVLVTSFLVGAILAAVMLPLINIMKALG